MSINLISPSTFTSGLLITDTYVSQNNVSDCIPGLTKVGGQNVSAALEIQSIEGALLLPRMSTAQRDALLAFDGMMIYNNTEARFDLYENGGWVNIGDGNGDVVGPIGGAIDNDIVVFDGNSGLVIKDSGVPVNDVLALAPLLLRQNKGNKNPSILSTVKQIGNLGHVQFTNDVGLVLVDGLTGAQFITNDFGPDSQVCCLITGELPSSSSTPSALLELQSTTGAFLISRMTTTEVNALTSPQNGMMVYDSTLNEFKFRQNGSWTTITALPTRIIDDGNNLFVGTNAGNLTYTGTRNVGVGEMPLSSLTSGSNNTAFGFDALHFTTTGSDNTAVGSLAAIQNTTGVRNVAIGRSALNQNTVGGSNVAVGYLSLENSIGSGNVAIGAATGRNFSNLNNCIFIGFDADASANNLANAIAIGNNALIGSTNAINLGSSCFVGINNQTPAYTLDLKNVSSHCAIRLFNTTLTPATPISGSGLFYVSSEVPYFMDSTGVSQPLINEPVLSNPYPPTYNNQSVMVSQGYNGGGVGGSSVGLSRGIGLGNTQYFDMTTLNANSKGFVGSAFDGKYIYYCPNANGQITRFDTTGLIDDPLSYSFFDLVANVDTNAFGFNGAVYDGLRYVYFIPFGNPSIALSGLLVRYDTTLPFTLPSSYEKFDMAANVATSLVGFSGGIFDGRYLYFVPNITAIGVYSSTLGVYDTFQSFTSNTSYYTIDLSSAVNAGGVNAKGFSGAVSDGNYIYFVPRTTATGVYSGLITRLDISKGFNDILNAYSSFDTAGVNGNSKGFSYAVYDGKYIYFVPFQTGTGVFSGQVTRYDTSQSFTAGGSYQFFDTSTVDSNSKGFQGACFDGRYVYYVPYMNGSGFFGQVTRYDITKTFNSTGSYMVYDTAGINASSVGFDGAAYDGKYLYLIPYYNGSSNGQVTRFPAYSGPQIPQYTGVS